MKVFISWSGSRSKKVALIFRDWFPSVIQSLEPFVSSEDIEKGARWNTDIAQELKESTFGIICVTKDNIHAPWLNFEAGALSKTIENNYVAPFLFDIKPSELTGSPISQFQATSFNKEDLSRLLETLNVAAGKVLSEQKLKKTFEVWYPDLEKNLNNLQSEPIEGEEEDTTVVQPDIMEELLETSRNTLRQLGNTDIKLYNNIEHVQSMLKQLISKNDTVEEYYRVSNSKKQNLLLIEEMLYMFRDIKNDSSLFPYNLLFLLSIIRDDYPWLYDAGRDMVKVIQSEVHLEIKQRVIKKFKDIFEFTFEHPVMRRINRINKRNLLMIQELIMDALYEMERL